MGTAANVVVAGATLSVDGTDVGFTRGGINVGVPRDYKDVEADQIHTLVKKVPILTRCTVGTTLIEATLDNLQYAWDQAGTGSIAAAEGDEVALVIVGEAPTSGTRTISLSRAVSMSDGQLSMTRDEENAMDVEFEVLATNEQFGTVVDS